MNQNKIKDSKSMVLWIEPENIKLLKRFQSDFLNYTGRNISRQQAINLAMTIFFDMDQDFSQFQEDK